MNELSRVPSNAADISGAPDDDRLIQMWIAGRSRHTARAYESDIDRFRAHVGKPMRFITASDIVDYAGTLAHLKRSSQYRMLSAVKSLFTYAMQLGYVVLNPAAVLRMPKPVDDRASKIISCETVAALIEAAPVGRDRLICKTLYLCGLRESELIGLRVMDLRKGADAWTLSVLGKGDKVRHIAMPEDLADELNGHATSSLGETRIFRSARGNPLSASDIYRIVVKAGKAVGHRVTPHGLRHAHASHALDNGAPIHLVRETLGHSSLAVTSTYTHAKPSDSSALYLTSIPVSADEQS